MQNPPAIAIVSSVHCINRSVARIGASIFTAFVCFLPADVAAVMVIQSTDPVIIDFVIDDSIRFDVFASVSIVDGALITGFVSVDTAYPFVMSGGTIKGHLGGDQDLTISGGIIESGISASDFATHNIRGGTILGGVLAIDSTTIIFHGGSFNFPLGPIGADSGHLTGILADGSPISVDFGKGSFSNIILVPEPSTVALLLTCCILPFVARWRK